MNAQQSSRLDQVLRYGLGALFAFGALNAFAGGYYGIAGAKGVPLAWLQGTPFDDYFVPSMILFLGVGGALLWAALAVFTRLDHAREIGLFASAVLAGWLIVQVSLIGFVSWMQPATAAFTVAVVLLSTLLPAPPSRRERQERGVQGPLVPQH